MTVEVTSATITRGTAGAVFDNNGGLLRLSNATVNGIIGPALISTGNSGNSFLQGTTIVASQLDSITATSGAAAQRISQVVVSQMTHMVDAFAVRDSGSVLKIVDVMIIGNSIASTRWSGISSNAGAATIVQGVTISQNSGMEFAASAIGSQASLSLQDSTINNNIGTVRNTE